ncbi:fasciclin domain-containing protein [Flavobacterium sp. NST-5]|uniref:Fasciclin domain-containing protein n=1 Tax=Flavobacterium ichthyis TaxID=2698827 RepID=A0ABW9Z6P5_9FLAO|nr:fasciclin domain-containing protein [Flavobacterium ichthyis]NBL64366.1 fasciclin domain-containing protein [Flavobacterium ichthyis]
MKNLLKKCTIACLALTILSCSDDDNNNSNQPQTIADIAAANGDFSVLVTALNRTGLTTVLDGSGQYTVFAPTNAAFNTFFSSISTPGNTVTVENVPEATLRAILLYHVIGDEITFSEVPASGYATTLSTLNSAANGPGISMFLQKSGGTITINGGVDSKGATTTQSTADIQASNGVIHVVDRVIQIPTIVDHVIDNPEFETLQTVVTSPAQSGVLSALSGLTPSAPATLFAPNNAAFATALGSGGFANGASDAAVTKVLQYHVTTAGNVRSTQLSNNQVVPMFTDPVQSTTIILGTNTVDVRDSASNLSRVFQADIQASNGVIHGVNRVLQPVL